jgi:Tol biopolymer transport system component
MPQFAFSGTGSLVYRPGPVTIAAEGQNLLGFADRMGDIETLKLPPANYLAPRVSRDGKQIAYEIDDGKESSVWLYELSGATAPRRLTLPGSGSNRGPIWSADGQHIAFQSDREGDLGIWWQRADGSGAAERLTKPDEGSVDIPDSWAPDGQTFSFTKEKKSNESEVWIYSLKDKKATVFAATAGALFGRSVFSPDGRWVAYQLRASPDSRVYVRPFPANATVYVAPADADSHHPAWSPDGKELFYTGQRIFGSMSFTTQPSVRFGAPVRVPKDFPTAAPSTVRDYDVLPDGKHFLLRVPRIWQAGAAATVPAGPPQIEVVLNWFEDVKQRVPGK